MAHLAARQAVARRNKQDNNYRNMDAITLENKRQHLIATFEIKSVAKLDRKKQMEEAYKAKQLNDEKLYARRKSLAALYNSEMEAWKLEALSQVETVEERKQRIMEKAYKLKEDRLREKERYIEDAYDRQWRDACDDARTLDSAALRTYMANQRMDQLEEKKRLNQKLTEEENQWLISWRKELDEMAKHEMEKEKNRHMAVVMTKEQIKEQIRLKNEKEYEEFLQRREYENKTLIEVREKMKQDEENIQKKLMEDKSRGKDILEFNSQQRDIRDQNSAVQKYQDEILLKYALQKERAQIEAEEMKKRMNRDAGAQYKQYLDEQMRKEADNQSYLDEVRRREEERVWKQRDEVLAARDEARKQLMTEVYTTREEQIRAKAAQLLREKYEDEQFSQQFIESAKFAVEREKIEAEKRKQKNFDNQNQLNEHIKLRRDQEELERQQEYLQNKEMEYMEKLHSERLANQGGVVRLKYPIKTGPKF